MPHSSYPPLKSLGQHFLRMEKARELVDGLPLQKGDQVVELGAGRGAMTFLLAERVSRLLAVEIDKGLARELEERVRKEGRENVEILHEDFLKKDWREWRERLGDPFFLVGNLPYHISTPTLFKIVENRSLIRSAYIMLQKEVADRLLAPPGIKAYGAISVLIGYYAEVRPLRQLKPGAFFPKPKVSSTFVAMIFREKVSPLLTDPELFRWVVHQAFAQRRKQIKKALSANGRFPPEDILEALQRCRLDPQGRGERLTAAQFAELSNTLAGKGPSGPVGNS